VGAATDEHLAAEKGVLKGAMLADEQGDAPSTAEARGTTPIVMAHGLTPTPSDAEEILVAEPAAAVSAASAAAVLDGGVGTAGIVGGGVASIVTSGSRERAPSADAARASAPSADSTANVSAGPKRNKRGKSSDAGSGAVGAAVSGGAPSNGPVGAAPAAVMGNGSCAGSGGASAGGARRKGKQVGAPAATIVDESVSIGASAAPGLENKTGQHSCFVNVVVQTLWNVAAFRDAFLTGQLHRDANEEDGSIYVAMKEVCSMMDDGANATAGVSDPNGKQPRQATASALKEALYRLDSNFELGEMHDATEAHEALLEALHRAVAPDTPANGTSSVTAGSESGTSTSGGRSRSSGDESGSVGDSSGGSGCGVDGSGSSSSNGGGGGDGSSESESRDSFVKRIFAMRMRMDYAKPADPKEEQSKPLHFDQWTQYVVASELRNAVQEAAGDGNSASPLVRVLRKEAGTEPVVTEGGDVIPATRQLNMLEPPLVFTLGLSNDSARASKSQISESLEGIEEILNLRDVYEGLARDVQCRLVALTAFYESHYVCFCFSQAAGAWIHYDDDTRRLVGPTFSLVKDKCIAGRLHPQLCFYEEQTLMSV